jgi:type VI secretion system protein ImpK
LPQRFQQYVRHELPLWLYFALLGVAGTLVFGAYSWLLDSATDELRHFQSKPVQQAPLDGTKKSGSML